MVAESGSDFHLLASNEPVDVTQSHPLIPELPTFELNLISLKVTIFPNAGVCIGISVHHVAADGSSSTHFMKSWAAICKTGHVSSISSLPSCNRAVIQDPRGLKRIFLDQNRVCLKSEVVNSLGVRDQTDSVRAAFLLTRADIERLKQRVAAAHRHIKGEESFHCSAFVVICAHVWVCMVAARGEDPNKLSTFGFWVDCRARLGYPIPETYFGNCVMLFMAQAKVGELNGVNGFVAGVESIGSVIGGLKVEVLNGAETMIPRAAAVMKDRPIVVAGSPKFCVYDTDFGWGRPKKVEISSIERTGAISLAESRDGDGGLEMGLVLPKSETDRFAALFNKGLAF